MKLSAAADSYRAVIDAAPAVDAATFARRTRNALAQVVLAAALSAEDEVGPAPHAAPVDDVRAQVGPELAETLVALYEGADDWTSRAIDALEPLHALARAS